MFSRIWVVSLAVAAGLLLPAGAAVAQGYSIPGPVQVGGIYSGNPLRGLTGVIGGRYVGNPLRGLTGTVGGMYLTSRLGRGYVIGGLYYGNSLGRIVGRIGGVYGPNRLGRLTGAIGVYGTGSYSSVRPLGRTFVDRYGNVRPLY